jgi:hypothetical protein
MVDKWNEMRNILCPSDQIKRERAWKQRSSEREKLFWLVLLSSGPHEKLYGPLFCLVHLQPALQYTGTAVVQKEHNGAPQTACLWKKWGGVQDRREFNKPSYWQRTLSVLDETMTLSVIYIIIHYSFDKFLFTVSSKTSIKIKVKSKFSQELIN